MSLDEASEDLNRLEEEFYANRNNWVTTRKKLGSDYFDIRITNGKFMTAKVVPIKEYYKRLLIRR